MRLFFEPVFELGTGAAAELHQFADIHPVAVAADFFLEAHDEVRLVFPRLVHLRGDMMQKGIKMGFNDLLACIGKCRRGAFIADDPPDCFQMIFGDIVMQFGLWDRRTEIEFQRIVFRRSFV